MAAAHPRWLTDTNTARLIHARAARMGMRRDGLEDACQEILIQLSTFCLDERKANGAKTTTVLVAIIDRRLRMWERSRRRYRDRLAHIRESHEARCRASGHAHPVYEERTEMVLDVRQSVASLAADDQRLCRALSEGRTVDDIAAELGCSWHTVKRRIDRLRDCFEERNLDAWLRG